MSLPNGGSDERTPAKSGGQRGVLKPCIMCQKPILMTNPALRYCPKCRQDVQKTDTARYYPSYRKDTIE